MVRIVVFSACALLVTTQASSACSYLSDRSVVFADNTMTVCEDVFDSLGVLSMDTLNWYIAEKSIEGPIDSYWDQWAIRSEDTPILTQNLEKNYFGLGLWMPEELRDEETNMSTEEWLKSHGLMFSVGFGDKHDGEPRMRFDYRWHEYYDADWMMQIEVPF
ncbi:MAG: hypothetical protein VYC54_04550 [Pseudomonadota bacterium]|nr:hypothetical protein [Pseudomonadota bacterium]